MSGVQTIQVTTGDDGLRLDRWFKQHFPALTHGRLEKLLRTGQVRVDGGRVKANHRLGAGQTVRVPPLGTQSVPPAEAAKPAPRVSETDRKFLESLILHKDEDVLVLNKPFGLAVQGGTKTLRHLDGMLDGLRVDGSERPRLVHRLDRDTSGVMVLARHRAAARALAAAFKARGTVKVYWGLVHGVPKPLDGEIKLALRKASGEAGNERMAPARDQDKDAKRAVTRFRTVFQAGQKAAWLALMPVTGRTHQIRVHCEAMGTPLVGDTKYGLGQDEAPLSGVAGGLHLHAHFLAITHPSGGQLRVSAPLPAHMKETWDLFGMEQAMWNDHWRQHWLPALEAGTL